MYTVSTKPVLVAGGSLVGLASAVFLSWRGVPTVLVERHAGSSSHPRAIGFTTRTVELLRAVGLADQLPQPKGTGRPRRARVESLTGQWFEELPWAPPGAQAPDLDYSPCRSAGLAQDRLEPMLREKAASLGADLRLETELLTFRQDDGGVVATVQPRAGQPYTIEASYLVAADGQRSPIREALGIGRSGRGQLATVRSVIFRAPLEEHLRSGVAQFQIDQPGWKAFLTTYADGRWLLIFDDELPADQPALRAMIARAIGRDDLPIEIVTTGRWDVSALIAEHFSQGRVFLAGDAAHTLPPNRGGYGANTGIEDAHNLAWKLAAVLSGTSTPRLLDTYDTERRPIAWLRHAQIFARGDFKAYAGEVDRSVQILDDVAMELGQLYRSAAVLDASDQLPPAARPDQWAGQPGTRAPHLWVERSGQRVSTLDLFQRAWVLLADGDAWRAAAGPVEVLQLGVDFVTDPAAFLRAFGLQPGGASLIRPDGYIAWRAVEPAGDPVRELGAALARTASLAHPRG
ncbi:MAG TPA: FAD-dependent monooxygenase [Polyangia bacterium]|nr:FAD-dependent monooxygenase [Polyangia bacterium]